MPVTEVTSENDPGPEPPSVTVLTDSRGWVELIARVCVSAWDADRIAEQLRCAARNAREILGVKQR